MLEQVVVLVESPLAAWPVTPAAVQTAAELDTEPVVAGCLDRRAPRLTVVVAKHLPLHDILPYLLLFVIIVVHIVLLVKALIVGLRLPLLAGLHPREDLLDERLVQSERLVLVQDQIGHAGDQRYSTTNGPQQTEERNPGEFITGDHTGLAISEVEEAYVINIALVTDLFYSEIRLTQCVGHYGLQFLERIVKHEVVLKIVDGLHHLVVLDLPQVFVQEGRRVEGRILQGHVV